MGELWRRRRWRRLLNLIDHLPADTAFGQAVSLDREYIEQAMRHAREHPDDSAAVGGPPRATWTQEADLLAMMIEEQRRLYGLTIAVNTEKHQIPKMDPVQRPASAAEWVRIHLAMEAHETLVARVLPHKGQPAAEE